MAVNSILYIDSYMRSGSTLLGMLLGAQPGITYLGEVRNFQEHWLNRKRCYCGYDLNACPFWAGIIARLEISPTVFETKTDRSPAHKLVKYASVLNTASCFISLLGRFFPSIRREYRVIENISRIYELVLSQKKLVFLCDSSHRSTQAKLLWLHYRDRFKIIHLVRDGRGVTNSVMKRKRISMEQAARTWKRSNIFTLITQIGIPKQNLIRVRYEDICSNPEIELKRICDFGGVDSNEVSTQLTSAMFHFVGGSSTIRDFGAQEHEIALDERWKVELTDEDKNVFDQIAGRINRLYGYA